MNSVKLGVLCYLKREGKTLMLYRNKKPNDVHKGKWNGLGGKIEPGESPEDAVCREVKEESNFDLYQPQFKGHITFPNFKDNFNWYIYLFEGIEFSGVMRDSSEGKLQWIEDNKIHDLNLWKGDYLFFNWMKREKIFSAKINYKGDHLVNYEVYFY